MLQSQGIFVLFVKRNIGVRGIGQRAQRTKTGRKKVTVGMRTGMLKERMRTKAQLTSFEFLFNV